MEKKHKPTFYTKSSQAIVFFCILAITIFVSSCSQELFEEQLLKEKITKKKITFEEFSNNKKAVKEFTIAKNELQSASFERAQSNHDLNIVIDTDNIQLIENDDYKSYTIPFIAQGRENKVDNMVIIEKGNYIDVKFISYNLTKQQLSQMNFGTIANTILLKNNNAIETECNTIVDTAEIYINPATGEISGYVVTYANPCPGTEGNSYVIQQIVSDGSPGGGDGGDSGDFAGGNISGILNFWSNLFGNNYSNGGYGTGEIYTLGGGGLGGSITSNLGGNTDDNWDSTDVVTNPVITDINFQNAALMLEVSAYLNHLKNQNTVINQFLINNFNANQFIINYVLQNGALTQELKTAINFTLNNIGSIYTSLEQNTNILTTTELELLKNNAFNFLLTNANWLANQPSTTQQSIYQYLFANNYSQESVAFVDEAINYCETNGNTPEVQEETKNILSLLTNGTINGQPVDFGDSTPITNMANYLSCFNTTQGAILTICADQPDTGDHDLWTISGGVGHSFIIIKQGNKVRSLGFYPISGPASIVPNQITPDPNDFINTPGEFHNNENTSYDVSLSVNISAAQLTNLINGTINVANNNPIYNLSSLNCTDMAIMMFEGNTNVNLPSCESPVFGWDGQTPGTLGEIIRNLPTPVGGTKDTNGGTSPQNNG